MKTINEIWKKNQVYSLSVVLKFESTIEHY